MLNLLCFEKEFEAQEMPERLLHVEQVLSHDKGSWSRQSFHGFVSLISLKVIYF